MPALFVALALAAPAPPVGPVGKEIELKLPAGVTALAFSPDGKRLLTGTAKRAIVAWDTTTGETLKTYRGREAAVLSLAWSPDGKYLAAGDEDGWVSLWDADKERAKTAAHGQGSHARGLAFTPDGVHLVFPSSSQDLGWYTVKPTLRLTRELRVAGLKGSLHGVAVAPDGKSLLVGGHVTLNEGSSYSTFHLVDLATKRATSLAQGAKRPAERRAELGHHRTLVAFAPDGKGWAGVTEEGVILHRGGKLVGTVHGRAVLGLGYTPDGKSLITADRAGLVLLTDVATGKETGRVKAAGKLAALVVSADGKRMALAWPDGKVLIRDVPTTKKGK